MTTKYFDVPFAESGDKTTIPNASQPDGSVSFEDGWTPDYAKDQATDPDAKDIPRQSENYFKFVVTEALKELQEIGAKPYDSLVNYPVGAVIPGSDKIRYECFIANGPASTVVDPVGDGTGTWRKYQVPGSIIQRVIDTLALFSTTSTTFVDTGLQIDFTNKNSANLRKITFVGSLKSLDATATTTVVDVELQVNYGAGWVTLSATRGYMGSGGSTSSQIETPCVLIDYDTTTDATPQYKVVIKAGSADTVTLTDAKLIVEEEQS